MHILCFPARFSVLTYVSLSFINVRFHHKEDQSPEVIKLMTMYIMESARLVVAQPMETSCIVFNMDGFTLSNMVCVSDKLVLRAERT